MIAENVKKILSEISGGNPFGEKITLVAATKTRTPDEINEAIAAGVNDIGENKVQEFTEKYDAVRGANRHFIGHLQTNKVKYLIGKTYLIHSLDRMELADELQKRAEKADWVCDALIEINMGSELSKSGFSVEEAYDAYRALKKYPNIRLKGLMGMLPISENCEYLRSLCLSVRKIYDKIREKDDLFEHLSMGMSQDWRLCVECGSNMIRLGTTLFGPRNYPQTL
ncbi:MAG TPA: YggS family pyridoxal phosphate-dependent enzyme [Candidatus Borkfalkia excrementavium]|uniref:Pyridoxal phosphate homeostasis protein n=1 Tax=Candidatus Borkfalkia excrementavium TaxID=2838505 RepID=A0A9D1Z6L2_9FIRM|nr:YggS family pyridoxal phosphate-dependent enzyme [Candidatus Borkfalkia excrementavium]